MDFLPDFKKSEMDYFENELQYLIDAGKEFAKKNPSTASNLRLTKSGSDDPHVQQILESFAFLTGNIQKQIDENSKIVSQTLLENLYPNLVTPIPSLSIVELAVNNNDPALGKGVLVPRDTLLSLETQQDFTFKFRTVYDTLLFPGNILSAKVESPYNYDSIADKNKKLITIEVELFTAEIDQNKVQDIRFYIDAGKILSPKIYDIIFSASTEIFIVNDSENLIPLTRENLSRVGFNPDECLISIDKKKPEVFKYFQEFFLFPEKYLFFDIKNIDFSKTGTKFKIVFACPYFSDQILTVETSSFKLRCTPIINLFQAQSEPIVTDNIKKSYKLYTNYLKHKFLFFHTIDKLYYIDEESKPNEIIHVLNYQYYLHKKDENYFYDFTLNEKEPNFFQVTLYSDNKKIFIPQTTLYADIFVTNGFLAEKINEGQEVNLVENYPVNKCILLKSPSKYLEGVNNSDFYWKVISYIYNDKLTFSNSAEFIQDLKSIISLNLEVITEKERGELIINAIDNVKISTKSFRVKKGKQFGFNTGKEILISINQALINNESMAILAQCMFHYFQNTCPLNLSISLVVQDSYSKKVLFTCLPKSGMKKII